MRPAFNVFHPVECAEQGVALAQKRQEADQAAQVAENAAEEARCKQEAAKNAADAARDEAWRQELVLEAMHDAYEAAGRLHTNVFPGGKPVAIPQHSSDSETSVARVVYWPLTEDGAYVFVSTTKRELYIGKKGEADEDISIIPTEDFVNLSAEVLREISAHLKSLGAGRTVQPSSAEAVSYSDGHLPNPDVTRSDSSVYVEPDQTKRPDAAWYARSAPSAD